MRVRNPPGFIIATSGEIIRYKIISTGSWNMNAVLARSFPHGLNGNKILDVRTWFINDDGITFYNPNLAFQGCSSEMAVYWDNININLWHNGFGMFSQADWNDPAIDPRCRIFITYTD